LSLLSQLHVANIPSSNNDHAQPTTNSVCASWILTKGLFPAVGCVVHLTGGVSTYGLKYRHCTTKLTSDMSYRKTRLLASRAYEDSIAPCVWHTRVQASGSHTDRRLHSSTHHQAATFDNPIPSQFYRCQRSQGQTDGICSSLAQALHSEQQVP
jgi:hypothetical protein